MMEVWKEFSFDASHRLPKVGEGHPCGRMHGHTYRVRVHIEGPVDAENGWVMDFADMKRACAPLIEQLDHHHLNEIPGLENPTAEALARWFWERLKDALPLKQIVVQETASSGCIYRGEEKGP